jgi:hypothetical protein
MICCSERSKNEISNVPLCTARVDEEWTAPGALQVRVGRNDIVDYMMYFAGLSE